MHNNRFHAKPGHILCTFKNILNFMHFLVILLFLDIQIRECDIYQQYLYVYCNMIQSPTGMTYLAVTMVGTVCDRARFKKQVRCFTLKCIDLFVNTCKLYAKKTGRNYHDLL